MLSPASPLTLRERQMRGLVRNRLRAAGFGPELSRLRADAFVAASRTLRACASSAGGDGRGAEDVEKAERLVRLILTDAGLDRVPIGRARADASGCAPRE